MRVMKAFEIEVNYQKHIRRLGSIQGLNSKRKVLSSSSKTMEKINNFKKNHLTAEIFNEREKMGQLSKDNAYLRKNLTKVYCREDQAKNNIMEHDRSLRRISSKSSIRSVSSHSSKIRE